MVLNVFRPTSRVHASRPIDANFRRFVPYCADVTALFLVDLTSRKGHETASRFKENLEKYASVVPVKFVFPSTKIEFRSPARRCKRKRVITCLARPTADTFEYLGSAVC